MPLLSYSLSKDGTSNISLDNIEKIAKSLGLSVAALFAEIERR